jgi:hypothetical protein
MRSGCVDLVLVYRDGAVYLIWSISNTSDIDGIDLSTRLDDPSSTTFVCE